MSATVYWVLLGVLGSIFLVLLFLLMRNGVSSRRTWSDFIAETQNLGLDEAETRVLTHLARALPSGRPTALLQNGELFSQAERMIETDKSFRKLPEPLQQEGRHTLERLRSKLGFPVDGGGDHSPTTSRQLHRGTYLSLCPGQGLSPVEGAVAENIPQTIVVEPVAELEEGQIEKGMTLTVLFCFEGTYWQFPSTIQAVANGDVYLSHSEDITKADRRRYQRITTNLRAKVAGFQFIQSASKEDQGPRFEDARLLEIAGPGLLLQTKLGVNAGQKILVYIALSKQRSVEAMGIVRRVTPNRAEGGSDIGVELMGLTGPELSIMIEETENAKKETQLLASRRRRYTRAAIQGKARIARMGSGQASPSFVDAEVTEIGATGLRVLTELQAAPEEKVALSIELPSGRNVESTGVVRRVVAQDEMQELAVELTGMTGGDLSAMINETDAALESQAAGK